MPNTRIQENPMIQLYPEIKRTLRTMRKMVNDEVHSKGFLNQRVYNQGD